MNVPFEPPRPTEDDVRKELTEHVRALAGPDAVPRPEQIAAVTAVVTDRRRTLLIARTGFGKSAVYFSATKMLRSRGWGPTVVVSPLLALMRDQVAAANRIGLTAATINSSNLDDWTRIEAQIGNDEVDLLLIAPERLANPGFRQRVFESLQERACFLVCDEAHCISDWGHDFRPDYRRLRDLLATLPSWTPVLATTATANQRVTDDVARQLGDQTLVLRTSLDRESLRLSVVDLPDDAHRLAWLAQYLPTLEGSGIIYCLTVDQAETATAFLRSTGAKVAAYTGSTDADQRLVLETALRNNQLQALVATSALGMGFDKADLAFCVHLGLPPSPVAYYQQIGRAGRAFDRAEVIALPRPAEDAAVWRWFESVSLPAEQICREVLAHLKIDEPTTLAMLERSINLGRTRLATLLNILELDLAVERAGGGWILTSNEWHYDHQLIDSLKALRRGESQQMLEWASLQTCRLRYLREALDDQEATDCGRCDNCTSFRWTLDVDPLLAARAQDLLRGNDIVIEPRKQWPTGLTQPKGRIKPHLQAEPGRALARLGDGGWNPIVGALIDTAQSGAPVELPHELGTGLAAVLKRWDWPERPTWICPVPSRRRSALIEEVASLLSDLGTLPVHRALVAANPSPTPTDSFQSDQDNSAHQVANVWNRFEVDRSALPAPEILAGPVLLVDDEVDSRWTITVAAYLLRGAGTGPVLPVALRGR